MSSRRSNSSRIRLSILVRRTHRLLFSFLLLVAFALGSGYLFWLNHMGLQGYILSQHTRENAELTTQLSHLDARIATLGSNTFLAETNLVEDDLIVRESNQYFVKTPIFTAQNQPQFSSSSY